MFEMAHLHSFGDNSFSLEQGSDQVQTVSNFTFHVAGI